MRDVKFNNAMKFVKNFQNIHNGISNIYVFTTTDVDGNITSEHYGMNLMTNYGFKQIYSVGKSFNASNNLKLYVGSGVDDISVLSNSMENISFNGLAATNTDTDKQYNYPMYYSAGENDGEGLITLISRFLVCTYPYDITNFPDPVYISEYGLGESPTALWTHSHVYDIKGNKTSITKNPNEMLTITVYMCLSFYEHIIQNGWSKTYNHNVPSDWHNRYTVLTTNQIMYNRMRESSINTYKRNNSIFDRSSNASRTVDTSNDNVYTNSTVMSPFTIYSGGGNDSGYIDGFVQRCSGYNNIEPQFLNIPENVEMINLFSDTPSDYRGFANKFGKVPDNISNWSLEKYPTITTLFDAKAYLFNVNTGDWSNELDIYNPDDKWYTETSLETNLAQPIYYSNNGEIFVAYLYQNLRPDDPIKKIDSTITTIYATNKYWDYNSWIWLNDYNNIPLEAQTAKYFITNTNTTSLSVHRESDSFHLLEKGTNKNGYEQYNFKQVYGCKPQCDNYEFGWFMYDDTIYIPSNNTSFTIGNKSNTESMTYNKWLVTFNSVDNKYYVTDMSSVTSAFPSPVEKSIQYSGESDINVNSLTQCYRTKTDTGLICMQATNVSKANVIDLRNEWKQQIFPWKLSTAIWGKNQIAYIENNSREIKIFDFDVNGNVGGPIPFPENMDDVSFMFAHTNYLWFTDGNTHTYYVNLSDNNYEPQPCINNVKYYSNLQYVKISAVKDCIIIYKYNDTNIGNAYYVKISEDVSRPMTLSDFQENLNTGQRIDFNLRYVQNNSLVLLITRGYGNDGSDNRVIDFGQYITNNNVSRYYHYSDNLCGFHLYGENIIYKTNQKVPIINYMPIKVTGKTNTITTMNNIKHLSNKQWLISFTNYPAWGYEITGNGTPPGNISAITNKNGTITGWK